MGIVIHKKKVETLVAAEPLSGLAALIDDYGRLAEESVTVQLQIAALSKKLEPLLTVKKKLEAAIEELPIPDDCAGHMELGASYQAEVGDRGHKREIKDLDGVKKAMGTELFMKLAKVTLKDIDNYLTITQREKVLAETRTSHSVKVTKRG